MDAISSNIARVDAAAGQMPVYSPMRSEQRDGAQTGLPEYW